MTKSSITLNNRKFNLEMKIKDLASFGLVIGNSKGNQPILANLVSGLASGDVFVLLDFLTTAKSIGLSLDEATELIENSTAEEVEKAMEDIITFFENSPLLSKETKTITVPMKKYQEQMANMSPQEMMELGKQNKE